MDLGSTQPLTEMSTNPQLVEALCYTREVAGSIPDGVIGIFH